MLSQEIKKNTSVNTFRASPLLWIGGVFASRVAFRFASSTRTVDFRGNLAVRDILSSIGWCIFDLPIHWYGSTRASASSVAITSVQRGSHFANYRRLFCGIAVGRLVANGKTPRWLRLTIALSATAGWPLIPTSAGMRRFTTVPSVVAVIFDMAKVFTVGTRGDWNRSTIFISVGMFGMSRLLWNAWTLAWRRAVRPTVTRLSWRDIDLGVITTIKSM
jgi:hypothetical protein